MKHPWLFLKVWVLVLICASFFIAGFLGGVIISPFIPDISEPRPYPNNDAVRAQIMHDIPDWASLDSFNLSLELRKWSTAHTLLGDVDRSTVYSPASWDGTLYQQLNTYTAGNDGVWCSGYAHTYEEILDVFGFESYCLSVGNYPELTHAVQLVKVTIDGHQKFVLQDPYLECTYYWNNGTPISWLEMCDEMEQGRYTTFYREDTDVDNDTRTSIEVLKAPYYDNPRTELIGEGVPLRGALMYEYSITNNEGIWMSREFIRKHES